jgi:hypothetical protein
MLTCYEMNKRYVGKIINNATFYEVFGRNGLGDDYVYYFDSDEDLVYFEEAYQEEDLRYYDYGIDYKNEIEDEEEISEFDYEQLPYPDISIFVTASSDEDGKTTISDISYVKYIQQAVFLLVAFQIVCLTVK